MNLEELIEKYKKDDTIELWFYLSEYKRLEEDEKSNCINMLDDFFKNVNDNMKSSLYSYEGSEN